MSGARCAVVAALLVAAAGCASPRPSLPSGAGTPFADFAAAHEEAVAGCRGARTVVAELRLSGRAGTTRLGGSIAAGFAEPSSIRLDGVAFGRAIFILAARDEQNATLLLPREDRVVRNEPPAAIVEALAGVALTPGELRAAVAGCGLGAATPSAGRTFNEEWAVVDVAEGMTYLRRVDGRWRVGGAVRGPLTLLYSEFAGGTPAAMHIRSTTADITLRISQLEINTDIDPRAFELEVPADAVPLSLEELRRAGPLGERDR